MPFNVEQVPHYARDGSPRVRGPIPSWLRNWFAAFAGHAGHVPMAYRPDIDGLRAIAVVPIVLFHLGVSGVQGGFVGVDIFFVISGYLVGGVTVREIAAGQFSIREFYQRRIRRIAPALLVVIAATLVAGIFLLLPSDLKTLARSMLASTAFCANFFFWATTDYFSATAHSQPLLHLWSLGVEEQFYLLFPLLALLIVRIERRALWFALVGVATASAVLSIALTFRAPQFNFFLLPTRMWELLAGTLIAVTPLPFLRLRLLREALAFASMGMIVWAIATFDQYTPFPGWRAALPCGGAAGLIAAGAYGQTLIGRLLGTVVPVFLGKISYSLYLWHWPLIVLVLMSLPAAHLSGVEQLLVGGLSLALAILSWWLVETPCRRTPAPLSTLLLRTLAVAAPLGALGALILLGGGLAMRFPPEVRRLAAGLEYPQWKTLRAGRCFLIDDTQQFDKRFCLTAPPGKPRVVLLGDSHAAHLWPGLNAAFPGSAILQITASGCRPMYKRGSYVSDRCSKLIGWALNDYLPNNRPQLVILSGFWKSEDLAALDQTLVHLRQSGQHVLLVGPAPAWTLRVPRLLAIGQLRGDPGLTDRFVRPDRITLDHEMAKMAARDGVQYVSMINERCTPKCRYVGARGDPLVVDDAHISAEASQIFAETLDDPALRR